MSNTIAALYGKYYSQGPRADAAAVTLLRDYVDPMWAIIQNRFPGTPRPEPLVVPVHSPAGNPTTFADNGTEVLAFDMHLLDLLFALTIMIVQQLKAEFVVPALASIYAERAFSAGNIETAAIIGAGSRLAVASSRTLALRDEEYSVIEKLGRAELAFVIAHELAHLAFSEHPDLIANYIEDHKRLIREAIDVTYPATMERGDRQRNRESVRTRLEQLGYGFSARSHYTGLFPETEEPVPIPDAWELVSEDKEFMIEVLADHVACIALLRAHRTNYPPEFLGTAAVFAGNILSTLQYLDELATGLPSPYSLARQPKGHYWQAVMRGVALTRSLGLVATTYEEEGEPHYKGSLDRIGKAIGDADKHFSDHITLPLIWSIDFVALERRFSSHEIVAGVARNISRTSDDIRDYLGFGPAGKARGFDKYLNVALLRPNDAGTAERAEQAERSANLGARFLTEGRTVEAAPAMQEAIALFRELAAANPHQYGDSLAVSLRNLSTVSINLGRATEALTAAKEAVEIERELAAEGALNQEELARSLRYLGVAFSVLGRCEEAFAATQEAVEVLRPWYELSPDSWRYDIAPALEELGIRFLELGHPGDGLAPSQEAVEILRELAADDLPRYHPDLARSLHNLGNLLGVLGRPEALSVAREAVEIRRQLAADNPGAYHSDLAKSLNSLATRFLEADRPAETLPIAQEAVEITRQLAADTGAPGIYSPELAKSLLTLSHALSGLDRLAEALPVAEETAKIFRELAADNPGQYRSPLAASLNILNIALSELGRSIEALPLAQETVEIFRQLAIETPATACGPFAQSLFSLALLLAELDRSAEALPLAQEAVEIFRELASNNPDLCPALAASLQGLSDLLTEENQMTAARAASQEAAQYSQ